MIAMWWRERDSDSTLRQRALALQCGQKQWRPYLASAPSVHPVSVSVDPIPIAIDYKKSLPRTSDSLHMFNYWGRSVLLEKNQGSFISVLSPIPSVDAKHTVVQKFGFGSNHFARWFKITPPKYSKRKKIF